MNQVIFLICTFILTMCRICFVCLILLLLEELHRTQCALGKSNLFSTVLSLSLVPIAPIIGQVRKCFHFLFALDRLKTRSLYLILSVLDEKFSLGLLLVCILLDPTAFFQPLIETEILSHNLFLQSTPSISVLFHSPNELVDWHREDQARIGFALD